MRKIESLDSMLLNNIVVPVLDELGFGDARPEIVSMSKSDRYGVNIVLRLRTDVSNVFWLCYVNSFLDKVLMSCVLIDERNVPFKVLDKAEYTINIQDLHYVSVEELPANSFELEDNNAAD